MTSARDTARLEAEAVRMVTGLLRDNREADDEPLAVTVIAGMKALGWRPTEARPGPDWRVASGSGQLPAGVRDRLRAQAAEAVARQEAEAKARVKAKAAGRDQDGGL